MLLAQESRYSETPSRLSSRIFRLSDVTVSGTQIDQKIAASLRISVQIILSVLRKLGSGVGRFMTYGARFLSARPWGEASKQETTAQQEMKARSTIVQMSSGSRGHQFGASPYPAALRSVYCRLLAVRRLPAV